MRKIKYITFDEICIEKSLKESALAELTSALNNAVIDDQWDLVDELNAEIRNQLDRLSILFQKLRYLETN